MLSEITAVSSSHFSIFPKEELLYSETEFAEQQKKSYVTYCSTIFTKKKSN